MNKKRGLSSEEARNVRQKGHDDALEFAICIGLSNDYQNDQQAKKDVIDASGDSHSVKGGEKKWQIFLYGLGRFETDDAFRAMNGIGDILAECIKSFPATFEEYSLNKAEAKGKLRSNMKNLADKLQEKHRLRAFLNKSLFNGGEVNYLTVKHKDKFHVFLNKDVIDALGDNLEICNSQARIIGQTPEQKVIMRYKGVNLGEVEMRNDSPVHYREIRFNMVKPKIMGLLFDKIPFVREHNEWVRLYGNSAKKFLKDRKGS